MTSSANGSPKSFDQQLLDLPVDERAELQAMAYLSDDTLWTIAREQMQPGKQDRISLLMGKNSLGTISDGEFAELSVLVEGGQRPHASQSRSDEIAAGSRLSNWA